MSAVAAVSAAATEAAPGAGQPRPSRAVIAYLTTAYPKVSHTFIRREIRALEAMGFTIERFAVRPTGETLADPEDREEALKTTVILEQPKGAILGALVGVALASPGRWLRAARLALRMSGESDRGLVRHAAYLAEACYLRRRFAALGVRHVHVHFGTNSASVARLVRALGGPTYSFTVHGPDEFDAPRGHSLGGKIEDCAFVVAITDYCGAQLRRWVDPSHWHKIRSVRCCVGPQWFDAAAPVDPASETFVCVGRLSAQKGHLTLLEAFAKAATAGSNARLVLAGDGELRGMIEARIAALGLAQRVTITGWIGEAEVRRQLLASRCLVLASYAEGLPMVIMEAFALGRPVIATAIAGIPELVRDGENGWLVPAGAADALAGAMREALGAPAERLNELANHGRALTRERHLAATEAAALAGHIEAAVAREAKA